MCNFTLRCTLGLCRAASLPTQPVPPLKAAPTSLFWLPSRLEWHIKYPPTTEARPFASLGITPPPCRCEAPFFLCIMRLAKSAEAIPAGRAQWEQRSSPLCQNSFIVPSHGGLCSFGKLRLQYEICNIEVIS